MVGLTNRSEMRRIIPSVADHRRKYTIYYRKYVIYSRKYMVRRGQSVTADLLPVGVEDHLNISENNTPPNTKVSIH
jgi:hypothetical protein